jgi:C4-dicarboxylate transporter, DctQ subunit
MEWSALAKAWSRLVSTMFALGATYLVLIVVVTIWDVVARNTVLPAPLWLGTFIEFGLPISTMLAAPMLVRNRGHVAMELIDTALNEKMRRNLIRFTDAVCVLVSLLISFYAALTGYDAWSRGEVSVLTVNVPRWLLFAIISAGFLICAVEFVRHLRISFANSSDDGDALGRIVE